MLYIFAGLILLVILVVIWWNVRRDYLWFQKLYGVKLPHLAHVTLIDAPDQVWWGRKRWRFVRKDGGKDRRCALNVKIIYPTVIIINKFKVYILDLNYARHLYLYLQDFMILPLSDCTFCGDVRKDLWRYFRGIKIRFVRHIAKLFFRYGWYAELCYDGEYDIYLQREGRHYVVFCIFKPDKVCLSDISRLPRVADMVYPVVATNGYFTNGAREYAKANNILLMDKPHIDMSFDCDCIVFIGRQG